MRKKMIFLNIKFWLIILSTGLIFLLLILFSRPTSLVNVLTQEDVSMNLKEKGKVTDFKITEEGFRNVKDIFAISNEDIIRIKVVNNLTEKEAWYRTSSDLSKRPKETLFSFQRTQKA